jgi:two-component system response regulator AtoC
MPIMVPPLRNRKDDIPVLCHHFVKKFNSAFGRQVKGLSPDALKLVIDFSWPGNVRELENSIQRGMVFTQTDYIEPAHLPDSLRGQNHGQRVEVSLENAELDLSIKSAQKQLEAKLISLALTRCGGNKSRAAVMLEMSYPSLLSKIKQYSL